MGISTGISPLIIGSPASDVTFNFKSLSETKAYGNSNLTLDTPRVENISEQRKLISNQKLLYRLIPFHT
ncbi:hypothetical protein CP083_07075 [Candidatus Bathyarchaeota archaeon B24-2]|nr:MAG: hypothetical protein CP083_07075 [Candidatus Bathyarchaeota archaeon B24-2]